MNDVSDLSRALHVLDLLSNEIINDAYLNDAYVSNLYFSHQPLLKNLSLNQSPPQKMTVQTVYTRLVSISLKLVPTTVSTCFIMFFHLKTFSVTDYCVNLMVP